MEDDLDRAILQGEDMESRPTLKATELGRISTEDREQAGDDKRLFYESSLEKHHNSTAIQNAE